MDRIDFSKMWGMGSTLQARERREWHLIISLAEGGPPRGVQPDGRIDF